MINHLPYTVPIAQVRDGWQIMLDFLNANPALVGVVVILFGAIAFAIRTEAQRRNSKTQAEVDKIKGDYEILKALVKAVSDNAQSQAENSKIDVDERRQAREAFKDAITSITERFGNSIGQIASNLSANTEALMKNVEGLSSIKESLHTMRQDDERRENEQKAVNTELHKAVAQNGEAVKEIGNTIKQLVDTVTQLNTKWETHQTIGNECRDALAQVKTLLEKVPVAEASVAARKVELEVRKHESD